MEAVKFIGTASDLEVFVLKACVSEQGVKDLLRLTSMCKDHMDALVDLLSKSLGNSRPFDLRILLLIHRLLQRGNSQVKHGLRSSVLSLFLARQIESYGYLELITVYSTYIMKCLTYEISYHPHDILVWLPLFEELIELMLQGKACIDDEERHDLAMQVMNSFQRDAQAMFSCVRRAIDSSNASHSKMNETLFERLAKLVMGLNQVSMDCNTVQLEDQSFQKIGDKRPHPTALMDNSCSLETVTSILLDIQNFNKNVLKRDLEVVKQRLGKIEGENKGLRVEALKMQAHKNEQLETISRRIGTLNESMCRMILQENMPFLIKQRKELNVFSTKSSRSECCFRTVREIGNYLQLKPMEFMKLQEFLDKQCKKVGNAISITSKFLEMVQQQILGPAKDSCPPEVAQSCMRIVLKISDMLVGFSAGCSDTSVIDIRDGLKLLHETGAENLQLVDDLTLVVKELFYVCLGPKLNLQRLQILDETWGLLLLFWCIIGVVRHPELELDMKGCSVRGHLHWQVGFGEVKSSNGKAVEKGKAQLNFASQVLKFICNVVSPKWGYDAMKALFIVAQEQEGYKSPLIDVVDGIIYVNTCRLPV